jgi:hypothetical protein
MMVHVFLMYRSAGRRGYAPAVLYLSIVLHMNYTVKP